jgi:hypothetical protein
VYHCLSFCLFYFGHCVVFRFTTYNYSSDIFKLLLQKYFHLVLVDITAVRWILLVGLMVFNATFNNISVISWRSVLLVEETGGPE